MDKILFVTTTEDDGSISDNALEALSAAVSVKDSLSGELSIGLIGKSAEKALSVVGGANATSCFTVLGDEFELSRYTTDSAAIEAIVKKVGADIVITNGSARMMRSLPGAAFRCDGRIDTHISGINSDGGLSINRWYYRQRMEATLKREQRPWFLSVDSGVFEKFGGTGDATSEAIDVTIGDELKKTTVSGFEAPSSDAQTIKPDADLLFVAGAGWTKKQSDGEAHMKDAEQIILDILKSSQASLGSSKSLVDMGAEGEAVLTFMSHLNQVGQTGATPRHPKGLATCCHGEEPHVVGWRFIKERRAVNTDANCGWAKGKADVVYIADAFAVVKKLSEILA